MKGKARLAGILIVFHLLMAILIMACSPGLLPSDDFGAYYTSVHSDEQFEKYSRTGKYADIIVDLGEGNGKLVFWRGTSYLPYWETPEGEKFFVEEIVPRSGDGAGIMPDKVNTYSRVKIIESTDERVVIHWRYLPQFGGLNPHTGVSATKFVDEYFYIEPDGRATRTIRMGTERIDDWDDEHNITSQSFLLGKRGISEVQTSLPKRSDIEAKVQGNVVVAESVIEPLLWFKFDEASGYTTKESVDGNEAEIKGDKALWKKGISGTALQFDGHSNMVKLDGVRTPEIGGAISIEGWVAIAAYPWSWCPIIQQADDVPEEIKMFRHGVDVTEFVNEEGELNTESLLEAEGFSDLELETDKFEVVYQKENDRGYFLGIDAHGHPGLKLRIGETWEELSSHVHLDRKRWYHIAGTYDKSSGKMHLFVDGKIAGSKTVAKADIGFSEKGIQIGRGKARRPADPVRESTFPGTYSFDGIFDEIKIYDVALSEEQISNAYKLYAVSNTMAEDVDMVKRVLPIGEQREVFGAYYTNMSFSESLDYSWRFSKHADVVVEFDDHPAKFIFWRGVSYIPMLVNEKGQWYSNEFNETWSTSGGSGCQEPMSDKYCYYNDARIIENTPARVVVHWRFPLADVLEIKANYVEETGWYDVADWYYYIYPDGVAVKTMHLWTSGIREHEWQETMVIFGPDQHPHEIIDRNLSMTMASVDGQYKDYSWLDKPPTHIDELANASIMKVNFTGAYDPVTICQGFDYARAYGSELTPYAVFCTWNHWPVAKMPSDGRYASYPDRTSHSSLSELGVPTFKEQFGDRPYQQKIMLEGMLDTPVPELIPLAMSWLNAPEITGLSGASGSFDQAQRAYVLEAYENPISFDLDCSKEHPLLNACILIKNWNQKNTGEVQVGDASSEVKQGIIRDTDGSNTLIVWVEMEAITPVRIEISK